MRIESESSGTAASLHAGARERVPASAGVQADGMAPPQAALDELELDELELDELELDRLELDRLCALALGVRGRAAVELRRLLARSELAQLARLDPMELRRAGALGQRAALRLAAAFALGRRVELARAPRGDALRTPAGVYRLMVPRLRGLSRETLYVLLLDGKHRLKGVQRVSEGTLTSSLVHPREVFGPALRTAAAALIAVHNHPSGDPEPSAEDLAVTRRLAEAGRLLGVPLLDHLVVGEGAFVSLRERLEL